MVIYKVQTGDGSGYVDALSLDELVKVMVQQAWSIYFRNTHESPYSVATINEDGSETWASPSGEPQLSPAQIIEQLEALVTVAVLNT